MHSYKGHPESYRRARKPNMLKGVSGCHKAKSYKTSSYTLVFKNNSQCSFSILDICLSYFLPCWSQGFRQPRVQLHDKIHYFGLPNSKDVLRTDKSISPQFLLGICSFNFPPGLIEQLYQHTVKETRAVNRQRAASPRRCYSFPVAPGQPIRVPTGVTAAPRVRRWDGSPPRWKARSTAARPNTRGYC